MLRGIQAQGKVKDAPAHVLRCLFKRAVWIGDNLVRDAHLVFPVEFSSKSFFGRIRGVSAREHSLPAFFRGFFKEEVKEGRVVCSVSQCLEVVGREYHKVVAVVFRCTGDV